MDALAEKEKLIDASLVCEWLGTSRPTLKRLVERGKFPMPYKVGKKHKWSKDEIDRYLTNVKGA